MVNIEDTREGMRGDGRKKDRKGGEDGISRKGKGKQRGKTSQKAGERSWGKEEREESSEMPQFFGVSKFLRKYSLGYLILAQVWAGFKCS